LRLAPQSAVGYVKLGQLRAAQKKWDDAEFFFRKGLAQEPDSLEAIQGLVVLDLSRTRTADALLLIHSQISRRPAESGLYLLQAEALLQNKQPGEAKQALARAVEIDKQNLNAFVLLAQVEASQGNNEQAILNYQRALQVAPNNVQIYVTLGSVYEGLGNWQLAQTQYQKALAIQPDQPFAANNLAYVMLEHGGSVNVALTLAQTARRGLPNLANSADTLAWAYFHNGAFSVAAPLLESAVKQAPDNSTYHYHLGLTYQKLNDSVRARVHFERAIRIDPKSAIAEEAQRALTQLQGT